MHGAKALSNGVNPMTKLSAVDAVKDIRSATCGPVGAPQITNDLRDLYIMYISGKLRLPCKLNKKPWFYKV